MPLLKKAEFIFGKNLVFRNAQHGDAAFILSLRNDENKSKYLSKVDGDIESQREWLSKYKKSINQAYFIITSDGISFGTVRLYDVQDDSFCWGSWLLSNNSTSIFAIESVLIVYSYALKLGFKKAHFDVRKANESVWRFHERFGAKRLRETELDFFYDIELDAILFSLRKYSKFLPFGIRVSED